MMIVNMTETETRPNARQGAVPLQPDKQHQEAIAGPGARRSSSAGDVVQAYLRGQVQALRSLEPMVRADEFDSVHQMRVATRRLRATLRTFGQVIRLSGTEHLAAELNWLGGLLGQARDSEM